MALSITEPGIYDLRSWQNTSASFSLISAADTQTALEQLLETLTKTVTSAVAMSETDSAMRTVGVIEDTAHQLALALATMPAALFHSALTSRTKSEQLAYEVSTTRIARANQTGVLVRVRETTGELALSETTIRTCLAVVAQQLQSSLVSVLEKWPQVAGLSEDSPENFSIVQDGDSVDINRLSTPALVSPGETDEARNLPLFLRGQLRLRHNDAGHAEGTVMLLFSADG